MSDADHVRLARIAGKLAAARAMPVPPRAFGVEAHGFKLGEPLSEAVVAEFEERHEVALPPAYRLFVTELGDGGWVQDHLSWCLSEQPTNTWDDSSISAAREWAEQPPF